jgi:hypothetical protein
MRAGLIASIILTLVDHVKPSNDTMLPDWNFINQIREPQPTNGDDGKWIKFQACI